MKIFFIVFIVIIYSFNVRILLASQDDDDKFIDINYSKLIPALEGIDLQKITERTPEDYLIKQYNSLRGNLDNTKLNYKEFRKRVITFKLLINLPINKDNIINHELFQEIIVNLRNSFSKIPKLFVPESDTIIQIIDQRYNLSVIDEQILQRKALRDSLFPYDDLKAIKEYNFVTKDFSFAFSEIIGRIFRVVYDKNNKEIIDSFGSATMTKLVEGLPYRIETGDELNGVITTADMLIPSLEYRMKGIYFIPYRNLNNYNGYPDTNDTMSSDDLIEFFKTSHQVFQLKSFNIRKRKTDQLSLNHNISSTIPQFLKNENIVFCNLDKSYRYIESLTIEFPMIDGIEIKIKTNDCYFAAGYPIYPHYNTKTHDSLESCGWRDKNIELIKEFKFAPFTLTQSYPGKVEFKDGKIINFTPNAEGMKGGALFRIRSNTNSLPTVEIFGCIFNSKLSSKRNHYSIGFY